MPLERKQWPFPEELPVGHEAVAETSSDGGLVVFALIHELRTAGVIAEHFVVEIEPGDNGAPSTENAIACLCIGLKVRESVNVA